MVRKCEIEKTNAYQVTWKSPLSNWFCEIELTKSAVIAAMHAADENSNELERLSSLAKFQAGTTLHTVSNESIQMHGGIGVTDEYDIGFYLKRARVAEQIFGSSTYHKSRYADISGY